MSKDPAFLFYTSDFLTGTMMMTDEQVGKYIRLLCLQHQMGRLSEKHMLNICQTYDEDIFSKFTIDDDGKYFNVRLETEVSRRLAYSESRKSNRMNKPDNHMSNICKSYDVAMSTHMETETINDTDTNTLTRKDRGEGGRKTFKRPTLDEVISYCKERNNSVSAQKWFNYYESNGWKVGKNSMKDWKAAVRNWEEDKPKKQTEAERIMNL